MSQFLSVPQLTTLQRNALVSPPNGTMIFNTDTLTYQYTSDNGTNWSFVNAQKTTIIHVSPNGEDLPSNGLLNSPYATISYALSQIVGLPSAISPYVIRGDGGNFTDTNYIPIPFVTLNLNGGSYTVVNPVTLDPFFAGGGLLGIVNGQLSFLGGMSLDFNALSQSGTATVQMQNIISLTNDNFVINGTTTGETNVIYENNNGTVNVGLTILPSLTINNCDSFVSSSVINDLTVSHSDSFFSHIYNFIDNQYLGSLPFNITVTAGQGIMLDQNNFYGGTQSLFTSTGATTELLVLSFSSSYFNTFSLSATGSSTLLFVVDRIFSLPTIIGTPAIEYLEISNGMLSNVTFVNSTPTDASVAGGLQGLDNQLALNSASGSITPTYADIGSTTNGVFTQVSGFIQYGKLGAGNVATVILNFTYTPLTNFVTFSIDLPFTGNFTLTNQASLMGSVSYITSSVPNTDEVYDVSSIIGTTTVQVSSHNSLASLGVSNTVNLTFCYMFQ